MRPFPIPVKTTAATPNDSALSPSWGALQWQVPELPHERYRRLAPRLPTAWAEVPRAHAVMCELCEKLQAWQETPPAVDISLDALSNEERELVIDLLGEGEVSIRVAAPLGVSARLTSAPSPLAIQESAFPGVWLVQSLATDEWQSRRFSVAVGPVPEAVRQAATLGEPSARVLPIPEGLFCGSALLAEIQERLARPEAYQFNLDLLPFGQADADYLAACLGQGAVSILVRGYGNCRISATATQRVWWIQHFNSEDHNILNTLEICATPDAVPEFALAAAEDLADSAERLDDVLAWLE